MWVPSLSVGLVTALLAWCCARTGVLRRQTGFLWIVIALSGTAMLGNYAPVWIIRSGLRLCGLDATWLPSDEVGGTYWGLMHLLPGYEAFRYPAKWTTVFAIALVLCAAHSLQHWALVQPAFLRAARTCSLLSIVVLAVCVCVLLVDATSLGFEAWLAKPAPDPWMGEIDSSAARSVILESLLIAIALAVVAWLAASQGTGEWQVTLLVMAVVLELSWCSRQWMVTAEPPELDSQNLGISSQPWTRVWAGVGRANLRVDDPTADSVEDKLQYQQAFKLGKLHLLSKSEANLTAFMTLTPNVLARVRHRLAQHDRLQADDPKLDEALAWLGVTHRLVRDPQPRWQTVPQAAPWVEVMDSANALHVKYLAHSRIGCRVESARECQVLVRVLQDGGWHAVIQGEAGQSFTVRPQISHLGLFQSFDLPAGNWDIELRYQAPGLIPGAWVSCTVLLLLVATVARRWKGTPR